MRHLIRLLLITHIITTLTACTVAYRHPSYEFNSPDDQLNFDKDRQACADLSERQHCIELKEKTAMICESDGKGGHQCRDITPKQCTVDTPEQCLRRKGWRKADMQGNYLE